MRTFGFAVILGSVLAVNSVLGQVLVNGSFESPAGASNWAGSGWTASGSAWREYRAARAGDRGAALDASAVSEFALSQDVAVAPGTWTLAGWVRVGRGAVPTNLQLRIEWKDAGTNDVQEASVSSFDQLEHNGVWRQIHTSASCSSSQLSFARVLFVSQCAAGTGDSAVVYLDDVELYSGGYTGTPFLINGGFERGGTSDGQWWFGSQWSIVPESTANSRRTWGPLSGTWDGVLEGWLEGPQTSEFSQCIYPQTTGTWTFTIWARREVDFNLSNSQIRIEWRDASYTNQIQADSVAIFTVPSDNTWQRYSVQGTCSDTNLFEIRAVARFEYGNDAGGHSLYLDDARTVTGNFTNTVLIDGIYHNHHAFDARLERIPGTNSPGPFVQANYATTTTTFYVLAPRGGIARYPDSDVQVWLYTSYLPPHLPDLSNNWVTLYSRMTNWAAVTLTTNDAFHALPAEGGMDFDIWRYDWAQPLSNGAPYPRDVKVYYSPIIQTFYGATKEDEKFLVRLDGFWTNSWPVAPQIFHTNQWNKDYFCYNVPPVPRAAFTNAGFEQPAVVESNWNGVGWQGFGSAARDDWAIRSGARGAYLPGWFTNAPGRRDFSECGVFQPLTTTGGLYTFAGWVRSDAGVDPNRLEMRLEWFDTNGVMVQVDRQALAGFPRDGSWHHPHVTGACLSNGLAYVAPMIVGTFWARTGEPDRVQFDDASFYSGSYTGAPQLANRGFEEGKGAEFRGSQWYVWPEYSASYRPDWGPRRGAVAAQFDGKTTNAAEYSEMIAQNVVPGTGTYTFSIWMISDTNFLMTNAEIRMGWYDDSFTNMVKSADVLSFLAPADGYWHEYYVTGTCTNEELYEVRVSVSVGFLQNTNEGSTCRIDDGRFYAGPYVPAISRDWSYHNGGAVAATAETVPGTAVGSFLQIDYARTTTTFYVIADSPDFATVPGQTGAVFLRTSYFHPVSNSWDGGEWQMESAGTLNIDSAGGFHGAPTSGSKTVRLFLHKWTQPLDEWGVPLTNAVWVYYSPGLRVYDHEGEYDAIWLVQDGVMSNSYPDDPQAFDSTFFTRDYGYNNQWTGDQDADEIADLWEIRHFGEITNCQPGADGDVDARNNLSEYIADSVPTDSNSFFHDAIVVALGAGVGEIRVEAPTTNSRVYDVWWKTNLLTGEAWARYGHNAWGEADGTNLWLFVTNAAGPAFYRTGVRLP